MVTPSPPPVGDAAVGSKLTVLPPKESWALVKQAALGRFAFVMEGWPLVMPVNYLVDGDDVVIRSDPGRKLTAARQQVQATLQVDSVDRVHRSGWSVLVFGIARPQSTTARRSPASTASGCAPGRRPSGPRGSGCCRCRSLVAACLARELPRSDPLTDRSPRTPCNGVRGDQSPVTITVVIVH